MKHEIRISAGANTMLPCIVLLEEMGYTVSNESVNQEEIWIAQKEKVRLVADDPCMTLGLAKLYEVRGSNWKITDTASVDDFLHRFYNV